MARIRRKGSPHYARATRPAKPGLACGHSRNGGEHTERPHLVAVHDEGNLLVLPLQRGDIEKGQVVLRRGHPDARVPAPAFEIDDPPGGPGLRRPPPLLVDTYCPAQSP